LRRYNELREARCRAVESRTVWGRVKNVAGWVMSAVCAYRLVTGFQHLLFRTAPRTVGRCRLTLSNPR
jgi:hypothetical protein